MVMVVGLVVGEGDDKGNADGMCQVVMQQEVVLVEASTSGHPPSIARKKSPPS